MEKQNSRKLLTQFNNLYKDMDDVYHSLARHYGLSDCAFWILYTIRENKDGYTQSQLCEMLSLSKQTVNSALKNLETAGYIRLEPVTGNQKSKRILLTDAGSRFAAKTTDNAVLMELRVFDQFSAKEQAMLFQLLTAYVKQLGKEAQTILSQPVIEGLDEHYND